MSDIAEEVEPRRSRRSRMADVAEAAGVSLATVDRSLNGRGSVKPRTLEHVLKTASQLGYLAPIASQRAGPFHFDIVLPSSTNAFLRLLTDEITAEAARRALDLSITLHAIEDFKPDVLAETLNGIGASDGIGAIAPDHPSVREAIRGLRARGIPLATLVTDIANVGSIGYVGVDNRAAGRLAGQLLGRLLGGRQGAVLLFLGSRSYRGHEEREIGFRDILSEDYPHLEIIDVRDVHDDIGLARSATQERLRQHQDIVGIYNLAAGNRGIAEGIAAVPGIPRIVFVAHELTEPSRRLLLDNVIDVAIDQDPAIEAKALFDLLVTNARGALEAPPPLVKITPIFRENLP